MVEAVLVDVDGTLIDNTPLHVLAWLRAFRRIGKELDANSVLHKIGMGSDQFAPSVLGEEAHDEIEQVREFHGEEYQGKGLIELTEALPGAEDLLWTLKERGVKVALASSGKPAEIEHYMDLLGGRESVESSVEAIITMEDVDASKPDADIFQTALAKLGDPSTAVVIGDTIYDVQAAAKVGLACICLLSGGIEREVLVEAGAADVYDNAADLLANLDAVLNPPQLSEVALGAS